MPYKGGSRLGAEKASKLGHLDVVNSKFVQQLVDAFEHPNFPDEPTEKVPYPVLPKGTQPFDHIYAVDGSISHIDSNKKGILQQLAFVKTALFSLEKEKIDKLDKRAPHPMALRDIMRDSAAFHATVFPLRNVKLGGMSVYDSIRKVIFESLQDPKLKEISPYDTLKWLAYRKWTGNTNQYSPSFQCPHCDNDIAGLGYNSDTGHCPNCGEEVYLSDMLGFHLEMTEDNAPGSVASAYMMVHETLFLFTGVRYFWENNLHHQFERCLFLKDGPLNLRSQYVKLIDPIRAFLQYAKDLGVTVHLCGQEKSGQFVDHLDLIKREMQEGCYFIPDNRYIREKVQQRRAQEEYGYRTNYGNKVFVKVDDYHQLVLSIPTGEYRDSEGPESLLGFERIAGGLTPLLSYRHENALLPIEMAHGIASLSTYPSARILKLFSL